MDARTRGKCQKRRILLRTLSFSFAGFPFDPCTVCLMHAAPIGKFDKNNPKAKEI
jgi:hypothetical protein